MNKLPSTGKQLAYLYSLLIIPKIATVFVKVMLSHQRGWLWSYDPIIILGYLALILLYFNFWRKERTHPNLTEEIPHYLLTISLITLILFPLLAYLGYWLVFLRPLVSLLGTLLDWGIFALIVLVLPFLALRGETGARQKFTAILASLAFLISPLLGPVFGIFKLYQPIFDTGGLAMFQVLDISLLSAYFIFIVLMYGGRKANAAIGFAAFCTGLGLLAYGTRNPVNFGSQGSAYLVTTYINGVPVSTSILQAIQANAAVIAGLLLIAVVYANWKSLKQSGQTD